MQGDPLEQFVNRNRAAFDEELPEPDVWSGISQQLDAQQQRRRSWWQVARIAASVLLLLACGALLGGYFMYQRAQQPPSLEEIAPAYAEMEAEYQREIDQKYQQLASYQHSKVVEQDLKRLDEAVQDLKAELQHAPPGREEEIVSRLLQSYRAKVMLLERVLNRIQTKPTESEKPNIDEARSI